MPQPALLRMVALPLFSLGCGVTLDVGAMVRCSDPGIVCDLDGGFVDAGLPIGDPQYGEFNAAGFAALRAGLPGEWHGLVAGLETWRTPIEMRFSEASEDGLGSFELRCTQPALLCVPLPSEDRRSVGQYRLTFVDADGAGEGEFIWDPGFQQSRTSVRFRNMLLQDSGQVLYFVADDLVFGSFLFIMKSGTWPDDAGTDEPPMSPEGAAP